MYLLIDVRLTMGEDISNCLSVQHRYRVTQVETFFHRGSFFGVQHFIELVLKGKYLYIPADEK